MFEIEGSLVPLISPFTDDGRQLSEVRVARLVRFWLERGVPGFYVCGDAGEFLTLSSAERKTLLEWVQRECQGTVPVVVNVSSLGTAKSLDLAQHASRHGAKAAFITPPYFGVVTPGEALAHIRQVAAFGNLSVVVGDYESRLSEDSLLALNHIPAISFCQMAAWDEWSTTGLTISANSAARQLFSSELSAEEAARVEDYIESIGPAPLLKSLLELNGLEVGSPRSPKHRLDAAEMRCLLEPAA